LLLLLLCVTAAPTSQILDRKGFVRIAVETGTPLVPVYHFGNSKLFRWVAREGGWSGRLRAQLLSLRTQHLALISSVRCLRRMLWLVVGLVRV
jgi:hypothetical protein